jgi:NADH-quinone oxidoreductase subunit G
MREIDGDAQINIIDRGYGSEIATFQEEGVHSLISGNLMDVCPVGAITTRDYRFKSRPWDNPHAVDTICTLCAKGCNTTLWLRAKPEWAKGAQLIRVTPRLNPEVNGYWMCDIGRFRYHWVEGDERIQRPLIRDAAGVQQPTDWRDANTRTAEQLSAAGMANPSSVRFLVSAHASNEELYLFKKLAGELMGDAAAGAIVIGWRATDKPQPAVTKFPVPQVDAPNVNGAADLGLVGPGAKAAGATPDLGPLADAVRAGQVTALYVFDPGPQGSLGDVAWVLEARRQGKLPLLIVQGVLMTEVARIADIVLPGAAWVEKDATYTNQQDRVQTASKALTPPGDAMEDWQILVNLAMTLGVKGMDFASSAHVRAELAELLKEHGGYRDLASLSFTRPVAARHWLQASNPSERWKWDFMFQDLPPVKYEEQLASLVESMSVKDRPGPTPAPSVIPLKRIE